LGAGGWAATEADSSGIRFDGPYFKQKPYQQLQLLDASSGLVGHQTILPPHNFSVRLVLIGRSSQIPQSYHFRYTASMNKTIDFDANSK